MGVIYSISEAFWYASGSKTKNDVLADRAYHGIKCVEAAVKTVSATTLAFAIGFVVPNLVGEIWWPERYDLEAFKNSSGVLHIGSGLFFSCWACKKTLPNLAHHVKMVLNPEEEIYAKVRCDLKSLFDDVMRFLVTMIICAIPLYLGLRVFRAVS